MLASFNLTTLLLGGMLVSTTLFLTGLYQLLVAGHMLAFVHKKNR
jgi:hypothetical protein